MSVVDFDNSQHAPKSTTLLGHTHTLTFHPLLMAETQTHSGMQCFHSPNLDCQSDELGCVLLQQHHPSYTNSTHTTQPHTQTHTHTLPLFVRLISI